jgi:quercetin dioxygenase-like cupin family protein
MAYVLEGEFTVISIPEGKRVLKAGGVDWAAKGTIHSSRNDSTRPARILVILFKER